MSSDPEQMLAALADWPGVNRYLVAFSGGMDSTVLLHAMAAFARARRGLGLGAVHVHHGLHPDADAWTRHCRNMCESLGVGLNVYYAQVPVSSGESLEAAARHARYQLLTKCMQPNDALLMAHHGDDQLETVLMRLMRGAGVEGLAGIPAAREIGPGRLLRPFLNMPRKALGDYARAHALEWLEDPSNEDSRFDRGFLRNEIAGPLARRWPAAVVNVSRCAEHVSAAATLLADLAREDIRRAHGPGSTLDLDRLKGLSPARVRNLLRHWIRDAGFQMPSTARLDSVATTLMGAAHDAEPVVAWEGAEIRRHRGLLYIMPPLPPVPRGWQVTWDAGSSLLLPGRAGRLSVAPAARGGIDAQRLAAGNITVRFREGGERLRPMGDRHHRTLRNLFQERGVVPWMRERVPLVYLDGCLLAVADLWAEDEFSAANGGRGLRFEWQGHPPL